MYRVSNHLFPTRRSSYRIAVPPHRTTLVSPSSHGGRPAASGTTADPPCGGLRVSTTTRRRCDAHGTAQPTRARVTHRSILVGLPGGAVLRPEVASVNVLHVGDRGGSTGGDVGHFGRLFGVLTGDEDEAGIARIDPPPPNAPRDRPMRKPKIGRERCRERVCKDV